MYFEDSTDDTPTAPAGPAAPTVNHRGNQSVTQDADGRHFSLTPTKPPRRCRPSLCPNNAGESDARFVAEMELSRSVLSTFTQFPAPR